MWLLWLFQMVDDVRVCPHHVPTCKASRLIQKRCKNESVGSCTPLHLANTRPVMNRTPKIKMIMQLPPSSIIIFTNKSNPKPQSLPNPWPRMIPKKSQKNIMNGGFSPKSNSFKPRSGNPRPISDPSRIRTGRVRTHQHTTTMT